MTDIKPGNFGSYHLSFNGTLLTRGFWIYVCRVAAEKGIFLYVGRTGDNAYPYAASPFTRMGQHLEAGKNAKGNTLARQMENAGLKPDACRFELMAFGPIFPEQKTMPEHKPYRDAAAHLEHAVLADQKIPRPAHTIGQAASTADNGCNSAW